jgi:hypothetical protein
MFLEFTREKDFMPRNTLTVGTKNSIVTVACATVLAVPLCLTPQTAEVNINSATPIEFEAEVVSTCEFEAEAVVVDARVAVWAEFQDLRRHWIEERGARASVLEMAMLPSYQNIIGMGEEVIPMILAQLQSEGDHPDHWFWALAAITRDNPVSPQHRGKVREMAKAWLEWGANKGHVYLG